MIVAAAVCPHPPLLLRELGGIADPVAELRSACVRAVRALLDSGPDVVVVVGVVGGAGAPDPYRHGAPGQPAAPLSRQVAERLVDLAGGTPRLDFVAVPYDAGSTMVGALADDLARRAGRVALLVMGDGSARRGAQAPGSIDDRAFAVDDRIAAALQTGHARALADLDADLTAELMVAGGPAFRVLGAVGGQRPVAHAELDYRDDPFGLSYFVATWTW